MKEINFNTYKIATKLPLTRIAPFFKQKKETVRKEYLKIEETEVNNILKYTSEEKAVYLYKFGCITFLNFNQDEISVFLEYLETLFIDIDYKSLSKFNETHVMYPLNDDFISLWGDAEIKFRYHHYVEDIASAILAKSTELYKIETELSEVFDETGNFIQQLNHGNLRANTKKVASTIAKSIRFKYRSIESLRLLDRPSEFNRSIESREIFDTMSEYFELDERYTIISNQMKIVDAITGEYFSFRNKMFERRLLLFEIFLLASFPLIHFLSK
jgi:uncharacterized Rmd1/YagE family protein